MKCNYELKKNTSTVVKRQGMYKALTITLISLPLKHFLRLSVHVIVYLCNLSHLLNGED